MGDEHDLPRIPSDIHEHLPTLYERAKECRHITEFGTRTGVSTTAFLYAQPDVLACYDVQRWPQVGRLEGLAGRTALRFRREDVVLAEVEETDLLFIDTWHVYEQLKQELTLHGGKARKYIVLHDTTTFGDQGEGRGARGCGRRWRSSWPRGPSGSRRASRTTTA